LCGGSLQLAGVALPNSKRAQAKVQDAYGVENERVLRQLLQEQWAIWSLQCKHRATSISTWSGILGREAIRR